ncbi:MAG: type IIL restriction-modification enzyme MmeI [Kofleriaceae bacterium]|nr:type IIL restriction-modification enzyme MmeI [Kofleriaceae bacterium]
MSGSLDSVLPPFAPDAAKVRAFVARWRVAEAAEMQNSQLFLSELCDVLEVPRPEPATSDSERDLYCFERPVRLANDDRRTVGRIDLYKAGCFVLEAKQGSDKARRMGAAKRGTPGWTIAMSDAYGQALTYARQLPTPPPFLVVVDVGYAFDLYACFDGTAAYRPFPDPPSHRFFLTDLIERPATLTRLRALFLAPHALDPSRRQAVVTREIAEKLAELARDLEETSGFSPEGVARFLMRCIFAMFAEDVGLFPGRRRLFEEYLEKYWLPSPRGFAGGVQQFFGVMNTGGTLATGETLYRFNGGLFDSAQGLALTEPQLRILLEAAKKDWSDVEPAIFGTLLERALDTKERHALGAHYTPRAYVERLVRPTLEEPLRAEWLVVQAEASQLVAAGKVDKAIDALDAFHHRLCKVIVIDPACGSGNFLYVALDLMKQLEGEVLEQMRRLGAGNERLDLAGVSVNPSQFRGIEKKPWAKEIAELVLWIGHLRWHHRLKGKAAPPPDPVLHDYHNVECRDAVLEWDGEPVLRKDASGKPVTRWDGETMRVDPLTGNEVPDEKAQVPVYDYVNPRPATWPKADFIVGNPPFIGNKRMRLALGDGYVEALRKAHDDVPDSADYVMYWWNHAAKLVRAGEAKRFGLITTNSITQTFNRRVIEAAVSDRKASLVFAIPDHPWVDSESGAAVRISMTALAREAQSGRLARVVEEVADDEGVSDLVLDEVDVEIGSSLTPGVQALVPLRSNRSIGFRGITLVGDGFELPEGDPLRSSSLARRLAGAQTILRSKPSKVVLDGFSVGSAAELQRSYPAEYQRLIDRVLPVRAAQERRSYREKWWVFAEPRGEFRAASANLSRYLGTIETSKFRWFAFLGREELPEQTLIAIALDDAFGLGVLSSRLHAVFALASRSRNGKGNDPRYNIAECFDPFPFPEATDAQKQRIRDLAERLDAHRKRQLAAHPKLTITAMYNVLEKLRAAESLTDKDRAIHEEGLVTVLRELHDELDRAVLDAYGWPHDLTDEQILERLVELNRERAAEEARGHVRWLRPDFQAPQQKPAAMQQALAETEEDETPAAAAKSKAPAWPKTFFERATAVRDLVLGASERDEWTAAEVARRFSRAKTTDVEAILESFAALGQLVVLTEEGARRYRRAARAAA